MQDNPTVATCPSDSPATRNTQGAVALLRRQKQFADYLEQVWAGGLLVCVGL
jgi:hypothetical protein